jgi:DNA-binding response OmpR family regulator
MRDKFRKPKILVIEDQPDVRGLLKLALTRAGCEVATAETGMEGLQLAATGEFDLITSDVDLPDMNGFEICSRLRNHSELRDTPVVLVTGRFSEEDVRRGREVGAADYITKPFELVSFLARLLSHIED